MNIKKKHKSNLTKKINKKPKKEKTYKNGNSKIKLFVMSVDNEKGQLRRNFLNYKYKWIKAIYMNDNSNPILKKVRSKVYIRYNMSKKSKKFKGATGNIATHIKILNMIVDQNLSNVLILEDDSIQNTKLPKVSELPKDAATLFSGQIRHPFSWAKDEEWRKNEVKNIIKNFKKGVNEIDYTKYRWTQSNAIFIPNKQVAQNMLNKLEEIKSFKLYYDMLLANNKLIKYLYYPAPFRHDDTLQNVISQIGGVPQGNIENYVLKNK